MVPALGVLLSMSHAITHPLLTYKSSSFLFGAQTSCLYDRLPPRLLCKFPKIQANAQAGIA